MGYRNLSLDTPFGSLAVYSLLHGTIEVAEFAKNDDNDEKSPFNYFQPSQNERILSMLAMPLFGENQSSASHVVTIDTNYPGFFKNSRKWQYELVRDNFQQRLFLEMGVKKLLREASE